MNPTLKAILTLGLSRLTQRVSIGAYNKVVLIADGKHAENELLKRQANADALEIADLKMALEAEQDKAKDKEMNHATQS